jgi:hypothetical protein
MSAGVAGEIENLRFFNSREAEISFCLEPWGDVVRMPPGASVEVVSRGATQAFVEIAYEENRIVFYARTDSEAAVYRDGVWLGGAPAPPA